MRHWLVAVLGGLILPTQGFAAPPPPADPLTAAINTQDAERFARLFTATQGHPTAEQIQKDYLDPGSYGVTVFTPGRITDARHLAEAVARNGPHYDHAIHACLPQLKAAETDLHSIYLALHGLLPDRPLPQIYVVFGAGNSGGTAGPGAQVLGLEVLCAHGDTPEALRATFRQLFAHETVHTFQHEAALAGNSPLLAAVLTEGGADFIAELVTGQPADASRAQWAAPREKELWAQFQQDMMTASQGPAAAAQEATQHWVGNYHHAPAGWPYEMGYWMGLRIWQAYYARAADKHQAIEDMLTWNDPQAVLKASGYGLTE
jgi:threonine dehydrogenase-like Zn-dependent dehydrogenase